MNRPQLQVVITAIPVGEKTAYKNITAKVPTIKLMNNNFIFLHLKADE